MEKNPLVSVLVANYNNKKYINRCLKYLKYQTYKNFEVIFFDDKSTDYSFYEAKKYTNILNIKVIINKKKKYNITAFDQLNSYYQAFKFARGKIIFFLDSDDYFDKKKISSVVSFFNCNAKSKILFDLPKIIFKNKRIKYLNFSKRKSTASMWPRFPPQSCISLRNNIFQNIFESSFVRKFPNITLDFRIAIYSYFISKDFYIKNRCLTYYFQNYLGESSKFLFLYPRWWLRRLEAHEYMKYFFVQNHLQYRYGFDFYITYIVCFLLNVKKTREIIHYKNT